MRALIHIATAGIAINFLSLSLLHGATNDLLELRHVLGALHDDVRREFILEYAKGKGLSSDDLSSEIQRIAVGLTGKDDKGLRSIAVGELRFFGTTNALEFLKKEVLEGEEPFYAFDSYASISGYDGQMVVLAEQVFNLPPESNDDRRFYIYKLFDNYLLGMGDVRLSNDIIAAMKDFLLDRGAKETAFASYLDMILCREIPDYAKCEQRRKTIERVLSAPDINDYVRTEFLPVFENLSVNSQARQTGSNGERLRILLVSISLLMLVFGSFVVWKLCRKRFFFH